MTLQVNVNLVFRVPKRVFSILSSDKKKIYYEILPWTFSGPKVGKKVQHQ